MSNTIELTPAELEMIKVKREQELLAEREAELKRQAQIEKDITARISQMHNDLAESQRQVQAATKFLNKLGSGWQLKCYPENRKYQVQTYLGDSKYDTHWEAIQPLETAELVSGEYRIRVAEHRVYDSWGRFRGNKGWKMYLSGPGIKYTEENRALSNVKTVQSKVDDAIEARRATEETKRKLTSAKERVQADLQARYPEAEVTLDRKGEYANSWKRTNWFEYDIVNVKFINGICVTYRIYPDASISRQQVSFPKTETAYDFLNSMQTVCFNSSNNN